MSHIISSYLQTIFQPEIQRDVVERCCAIINDRYKKCKYIVVQGLSGTVIGSIVAAKSGRRLVIVRKEDEVSHGIFVEGLPAGKDKIDFIILDDFVSLGKTISRIADGLGKCKGCKNKLNFLGYLMYNESTKTRVKLPFDGPYEYFKIEP